MNIEGTEKFALKGLFKYINIVENVAISCHDFRSNRGESEFYKAKWFVIKYLKNHSFILTFQNSGIDYIDDWVYGYQ